MRRPEPPGVNTPAPGARPWHTVTHRASRGRTADGDSTLDSGDINAANALRILRTEYLAPSGTRRTGRRTATATEAQAPSTSSSSTT